MYMWMYTHMTCPITCQSLVLVQSKQKFCSPPRRGRHAQRAAASSALSLSTQSHCLGVSVMLHSSLTCRELLFLALYEGDEAVWSLNYIFSGNGWTKCWVSKAIYSFKVHLKYLCFEYESELQRPLMVSPSLPMSSCISGSLQLAFT